ncbi:protein trichome birefringence-like 35 [Andrographis paniculata]|uniref:protein trichome birefringence-like 35 n=1 Tax=Andrographis paniculata TaxID=175694 RepID=UPI0021E76124|nr:protein trichome birefringence-like 35 [Andrographis paniculata]
MHQRWQKRKSQLPLIAILLFIFVAFTILYNESNIPGIHHRNSPPSGVDGGEVRPRSTFHGGDFFSPTPPQSFGSVRNPPVRLDKHAICNSTVKYSGRRAFPAVRRAAESGVRPPDRKCDLFSGKWIFDNKSHPLYEESQCPYMSDQLACHKHGRHDLGYQFWKWQPHGCNLKRWNSVEMWEKLRGKRLMFVGDSLNRGQWISMLCLLQAAIPSDQRSITPNSELTIFRAENYNATVEFLWAPLLVESNSDDPVDHRLSERILHPDAVRRHSSRWQHADILVFNSYLWWRQGPVKLLWSDEQNGVCEEIGGQGGMELAMEVWADWVAGNVDPSKKKVFFVTMSPTHMSKDEWEPGSRGNCYGEKEPIEDEGYWGRDSDMPTMRMVGEVLRQLGSKVTVLNITQLSEYRKDGHPTIYRKFWETLGPEKLADPASYSDCIHWCLPGVPDVWNELLFQFL